MEIITPDHKSQKLLSRQIKKKKNWKKFDFFVEKSWQTFDPSLPLPCVTLDEINNFYYWKYVDYNGNKFEGCIGINWSHFRKTKRGERNCSNSDHVFGGWGWCGWGGVGVWDGVGQPLYILDFFWISSIFYIYDSPAAPFLASIRLEEHMNHIASTSNGGWQGTAALLVHQHCSVPVRDSQVVKVAAVFSFQVEGSELERQHLPQRCS